MRFLPCFVALALVAPAASAAPFTVRPGGKSFDTLGEAVATIGDGEATIVIAAGRYPDCAVQTAGKITYRAERPLAAIFDGGVCEGKATLVLRGRGAVVDGLAFENLRVPDGNGAGIRIERGPLTVLNSAFRNSEEGILGGGRDAEADVVVDHSSFSGLGRCDRGLSCAHSIYMDAFRSLTVRRTRFERGRGGHYLKSGSPRIAVSDCIFDDSQGRATNYMIDLFDGAVGHIEHNAFIQGANKENHTALIAIAAASRTNRSAGLVIANNIAKRSPTASAATTFVVDHSRSPKTVSGNVVAAGIDLLANLP